MSFMPKEEKPKSRRGTGASCRECRRLKVRCDREVPCGSCVRRGCSGICPDGQLSAVKSARYVLASTEELHGRIQTLTFRVHELEHALETTHDQLLQAQVNAEPSPSGSAGQTGMPVVHPMLEPHRKRIAKDPREQDGEDEDGFNSPARLGAMSSDFGTGAGEFNATFDAGLEVGCSFPDISDPEQLADKPNRMCSLPFSPMMKPRQLYNKAWFLRTSLNSPYSSLPTKEEAWALIDAYYDNAIITYQPIPRTRAMSTIIVPAYTQDLLSFSAFELSSLYSLLALGALHDLKKPVFNPEANKWLAISQALLLSQASTLGTNLAAIEAMMLLALAFLSTQKVDSVKAYHVTAVAMRSAQLAGLHKDSDDGMSSPTELTRRRHIFWELWSLDSALALEFDRPPAMIKAFIQFELPTGSAGPQSHDTLYLNWKYNLSAVSQETLTLSLLPSSNNTPYTAVMVLDSKIRAARPASLPHEIESRVVQGGVDIEPLDMVRSIVINGMAQVILLHLHRPYFAYSILKDDQNPMTGRMSPSMLACYNGAIDILNGAFQLLEERPGLVSRLGALWPSYTISTIILYAIGLLMPYWSHAFEAVRMGDRAVKELFELSASESHKAQQATPTLLKLQALAHNAMQRHSQGLWTHPSRRESPLMVPRNITPPQTGMPGVLPTFPSSSGGAFYAGASGSGNPGSLTASPRQIPALPAANYPGSSRLSAMQVLSFSVPSSTEEASRSFNPSPSWDSLMRGLQTSTAGPAGIAGLGPADGPGFPSAKALRMAWPSLLKKLGVMG